MKTPFTFYLLLIVSMFIGACNSAGSTESKSEGAAATTPAAGQSAVKDDASAQNIVQVASGSKDHTTLVAAVKAAELVDVLSNAGPFTVFAPTNAAFNELPAGTVEGLLKPEKKADLQNILQYHVSVAVFKAESFKDGQVIGQVNGDNITITLVDGKPVINGVAHIVASIPTSNGIIHVIDKVLLPPAKK